MHVLVQITILISINLLLSRQGIYVHMLYLQTWNPFEIVCNHFMSLTVPLVSFVRLL